MFSVLRYEDRQTGRQTDKQGDRQTETQVVIIVVNYLTPVLVMDSLWVVGLWPCYERRYDHNWVSRDSARCSVYICIYVRVDMGHTHTHTHSLSLSLSLFRSNI